ncbi:MAG: purine-nucleoside phosphorylase [Ruminococcaceae bacterium]|nr:purine-nucleoside phosphorylase [Oscillospiraceae bacterium]
MGTPHIRAEKGEIAERILLPGDPLRAKYIAEKFLENPVLFNDVRGILGYTGTYKGIPVSTMGTGMGVPSISIYVNELIEQYGVKTLIRVGTCGAMQREISIKDVIIASGCATDSGLHNNVFTGDFAALADFEMLNKAYELSTGRGMKTFVGPMLTSDMFYGEKSWGDERWAEYGILGGEMEGVALYTLAAKYKVRALTITTVSDSLFDKNEMTSEEREKSLNDMIELALDTVIEF